MPDDRGKFDKKYKSEEWLEREYIEEKKSLEEIGQQCGVDLKTIANWLRRKNISVRPPGGPIKYNRLRDIEWLKQKYIKEEMTTTEIGDVIGADPSTVNRALHKTNIEVREKDWYSKNSIKIDKTLEEFLIGTLLGDGSLTTRTGGKSAFYGISQIHKEYLIWIKNFLREHGMEQSGTIARREIERFGTESIVFHYNSKTYREELSNLQHKWYPKGDKIVPPKVELTPITLRHWHIEDGSYKLPKSKEYKYGEITLSTEGFERKYVEKLAEKLSETLEGETVSVSAQDRIFMGSKSAVDNFFDYALNLPPELEDIYGYKWPPEQ